MAGIQLTQRKQRIKSEPRKQRDSKSILRTTQNSIRIRSAKARAGQDHCAILPGSGVQYPILKPKDYLATIDVSIKIPYKYKGPSTKEDLLFTYCDTIIPLINANWPDHGVHVEPYHSIYDIFNNVALAMKFIETDKDIKLQIDWDRKQIFTLSEDNYEESSFDIYKFYRSRRHYPTMFKLLMNLVRILGDKGVLLWDSYLEDQQLDYMESNCDEMQSEYESSEKQYKEECKENWINAKLTLKQAVKDYGMKSEPIKLLKKLSTFKDSFDTLLAKTDKMLKAKQTHETMELLEWIHHFISFFKDNPEFDASEVYPDWRENHDNDDEEPWHKYDIGCRVVWDWQSELMEAVTEDLNNSLGNMDMQHPTFIDKYENGKIISSNADRKVYAQFVNIMDNGHALIRDFTEQFNGPKRISKQTVVS